MSFRFLRALQLLSLLIALSFGLTPAVGKTSSVQAIDLPREIFTGENLETEADFRRVADSIKITPRGAKFTKQQLRSAVDVLVALVKVAESKSVGKIFLSTSSDLFASLDVTLAKKPGWKPFQPAVESEVQQIEIASLVAFVRKAT